MANEHQKYRPNIGPDGLAKITVLAMVNLKKWKTMKTSLTTMKTDKTSWKSIMSKNIVNNGLVQIIALVEMVQRWNMKHRRCIATKNWPSSQSNAHHMKLWFTSGLPFSSASKCWSPEISDLEISGAVCFSYICTQNNKVDYNYDDDQIRMRMINHERTMGKPCGWVERRNAVHD